jgi:argininosuccinate lyase
LAPLSRSGVFNSSTDARLEQFTESISIDARLFSQDIRGSIAHARMLARVGILTSPEAGSIVATLEAIGSEIQAGTFPLRRELEDIHMNVEQALIDRLGDVGRKLHTGRSRNDQVATDLRLWVRDQLDLIDKLLCELQLAFLSRCRNDEGVIVPSYTHLQRAQPVLAAHVWLAYIEKFQRDRSRLADCRKRANASPLGGAAVAGTALPIDRHWTANELGFNEVAANSIDISSDRDFALEAAFVLSLIATHLSGWSEEWILWSTVEFNFIELPHAFCTGSSIMPQKINPDTLELTRGKTARVHGNLVTLLTLTKGLPLAYNRDLQEDKRPLFDAFDTVQACLELAIPIVKEAKLLRASIEERLDQGFLDATALMETLIAQGVPQRTAHHWVGSLVGIARQRMVGLRDLTEAEFQSVDPSLNSSLRNSLGVEGAVNSYRSYGSSQPAMVADQVARWERALTAELS